MMKQTCYTKLVSFILVLLLGAVMIGSAQAETVAWWRFEDAPQDGAPVAHNPEVDPDDPNDTPAGKWYPGVLDMSGHGNHLSAWDVETVFYSSDVPIDYVERTGDTNQYSLRIQGNPSQLYTSSAHSEPGGVDIEQITPLEWTIEAWVQTDSATGWRTVVGRDANSVSDEFTSDSALYFQIMGNPVNAVRLKYADVSGYSHDVQSEGGLVMPTGQGGSWYYMVAVNDGQNLSLYLNNELVGELDLLESGSPDTSLARGEADGDDWHAGAWTVGRGLWGSNQTDFWEGYIDEVRITTSALDQSEWLYQSVLYISTQPEAQVADIGDDITFELAAESPNLLTYQWYKSNNDQISGGDTVVGSDPNLTITNVQRADQAFYYCRVEDLTTGMVRYSNVVGLGIKELAAHWTLDESDSDPWDVFDVSGNGYDAQWAWGPGFFVPGIVNADGVLMTEWEGWAEVVPGPNPSRYTNQLTISFWVNWDGPNENWQTFISKREPTGWGNADGYWQVGTDNDSDTIWLESPRGSVAVSEGLIADGEWQFIVATFDGQDGRVYIDGELRAQGGFQFGDHDGARVVVGAAEEQENIYYANGAMDDVKLYTYARDEIAIAMEYYEVTGILPCVYRPDDDINLYDDCVIDARDLSVFAESWLESGLFGEFEPDEPDTE